MDTEAFTEACALLPDSAAWGDPITPEVVLAIAEAAKDVECARLLSMPRLMHGCDSLGSPADGEHCELLRRAILGA